MANFSLEQLTHMFATHKRVSLITAWHAGQLNWLSMLEQVHTRAAASTASPTF